MRVRFAQSGCGSTRLVLLLLGVVWLVVVAGSPAAAIALDSSGDAARGERLFFGQIRFANGGPACAACHDAAGLPSVGGGTMGPDLTHAFEKYGPEPLDIMLATLFFPTMQPLFADRLLTSAERADLEAFLAAEGGRRPPHGATSRLVIAGALLFAVSAAIVAWLGRTRLQGVRSGLVRRARASGRASP